MRLYKMEIAKNAGGKQYIRASTIVGPWLAAFTVEGPDGSPYGWVTYRQWSNDVHELAAEVRRLKERIAEIQCQPAPDNEGGRDIDDLVPDAWEG